MLILVLQLYGICGNEFIFYNFSEIDILYPQAPNYPDPGRSWAIVDKYKVTLLYTAPTLVRSLMREGNEVTRIIFQLFNAINQNFGDQHYSLTQ